MSSLAFTGHRPKEDSLMHTLVASVQDYGRFDTWPNNVVYVGMPGRASRAFDIPDAAGRFGKPWNCLDHPLGWPTGYLRQLIARLQNNDLFRMDVADLHGKTLLCWCSAKDAPRCHAMILSEFAELLYHEVHP